MRFLVWLCRVVVVVVIGAFVAIIFYLTHSVSMPEEAKAALNWVTVAGTALVGLAWPLMRRYWQALLLLISLGVLRGLFGEGPGLSSLRTPLLTPFQSDFLWVSIGVVFVASVAALVTRAILSDRAMRAMRTVSTVTTAEAVAAQTTAVLQETPILQAPEPVAPPVEVYEAGARDAGQAPEVVKDSTAEEPVSEESATKEPEAKK